GYGDVKTVQAAIPRLGFKETLSIVVAVANRSMYETRLPQYRLLMDKLWGHSLAAAYGAKFIAQNLSYEDPETIFLMGLTHDIGKVVLLRAFAEVPQERNLPTDAVMAAVQDAHQSIGNLLLKRWGFGEDYARVIALHEGSNFSPDTNREILMVHLANIITRKAGFSFFSWDDPAEIISAQLLGVSPETIVRTEEMIRQVISDLAHLF
ncbi:MAG TPA: HDOD domain-containing protein, partial [Steroidobacteraceae bacterium]|nr:HDOD domain-containing protein [Steroidobacteraceae bacterium]